MVVVTVPLPPAAAAEEEENEDGEVVVVEEEEESMPRARLMARAGATSGSRLPLAASHAHSRTAPSLPQLSTPAPPASRMRPPPPEDASS